MDRIFVDTSAWFAYANRRDPDHAAVSEFIGSFAGRLITSNYIFDETVSLCRYRLGHEAGCIAGSVLNDPDDVDMVRITPNDERDAWALFCARPDQRYSFTDCTSFTLMRRLGLTTALALDLDFEAEGFLVAPGPHDTSGSSR